MAVNGPEVPASDVQESVMTSAMEVSPGAEQSPAGPQLIQRLGGTSQSVSPRSDGRSTPTRRYREDVNDTDAGRGARRRVESESASARGAVPANAAVEGADSQSAGGRTAGVEHSPLGATRALEVRSGRESGSPGSGHRCPDRDGRGCPAWAGRVEGSTT